MPLILIAEDEPAIADTLLYALRSEGLQAEHCLLGREVVPRVRRGGIDVLVLEGVSTCAVKCAGPARLPGRSHSTPAGVVG